MAEEKSTMKKYIKNYEASLIAVVFDETYDFVDILHCGIAHSEEEAGWLLTDELYRLIEDFEPHKIEVEESRSTYDEPITVVKCGNETYHYYLMFNEEDRKVGRRKTNK